MKEKTKTTIGQMSNSRLVWGINPVSRIKPGKKKEMGRKQSKEYIKKGKWDE